MKKIILMVLLLTSSQMAMAVNWIDVKLSSKKNNEKTYIDLDTFGAVSIGQKTYISAWVKQDYPKIKKLNDGKLFSSEVTLNYFDCVARKFIIVEQYRYHNGIMIWSAKNNSSLYSSQYWDSAIPNSVGGALLDEVCTSYTMMKTR